MSNEDKQLVDAGVELMRSNPKMTAGHASRKVCPGPENSARRQSIRNAIDYIVRTTVTNVGTPETVPLSVKRQRRLEWFLGAPSDKQTPWTPSKAPWQADRPSSAFIKMLGDYGDLGKWTQEYFDAQMSTVEGGNRFVKESQADFAKPLESDYDGESCESVENVPYTGKRRNGVNYLDITEYYKRSDLGAIPRNLRLALIAVEEDVMRGERKSLYRTMTPAQLEQKRLDQMPWVEGDDMRTSVGKAGEWDAVPQDTIYTDDSDSGGDS